MTRLIKTLENLQRMMLKYRIQMERLTVKDYPRITHGAAPNGKQVTNKANTNQLQHPKSRGSCSRTGTIQKTKLVLIEPSNVHSTHTFTNLITGGDHSKPSCFCGPPRVACIHLFTALLGLNSFCKNVFIRLFSIFKNTEFDKFFFKRDKTEKGTGGIVSGSRGTGARSLAPSAPLALPPVSVTTSRAFFCHLWISNPTKRYKATQSCLIPVSGNAISLYGQNSLQLSVTLNDIHSSLKTVALE